MYSIIGLSIDAAKEILESNNIQYSIKDYDSRFKEGVITDSKRVIQERELNNKCVEIIVSDFKTIAQG